MDKIYPKIFLEELDKEKKIIEKFIKQLEDSIIDNETKYLVSTVNNGNILRGWEHIFTSKSNKIQNGIQVKKTHISNNEKLFSQTFDFEKNQENTINNEDKHASTNNTSNNLRLEENRKHFGANINIKVDGNVNINHNGLNKKHKKPKKNFLRVKTNRNNINSKSNDKGNKEEENDS